MPGVDYTKIGGVEGYKWVHVATNSAWISADALGYVYSIQMNDYSIKYRTPGSTDW